MKASHSPKYRDGAEVRVHSLVFQCLLWPSLIFFFKIPTVRAWPLMKTITNTCVNTSVVHVCVWLFHRCVHQQQKPVHHWLSL